MKKIVLLLVVAACLGAGGVKAAEPAKPTQKLDHCPPAPGSHLRRAPSPNGSCDHSDSRSRSYSREEIERTGQVDLNKALPQLDPALTSQGATQSGGQR